MTAIARPTAVYFRSSLFIIFAYNACFARFTGREVREVLCETAG
jgi:hypothetical protein